MKKALKGAVPSCLSASQSTRGDVPKEQGVGMTCCPLCNEVMFEDDEWGDSNLLVMIMRWHMRDEHGMELVEVVDGAMVLERSAQ